jgi:hypothetical protein
MRIWTRRRFLGALLLGGGGVAADMALIEPHALRTIELDVPLSSGPRPEPLRLLHMSDFHASECVSLEFLERAVRLGLETKPDLICLTGDFISWQWTEWPAFADVLRLLSAAAPTFAVLGNHDGGPWAASSRNNGYGDATLVRELLRSAGITLLHNASQPLQIRGRNLLMTGVGDLYNREVDAEQAFARVAESGAATILLNHNPDAKTLVADRPWDLMLCGHTHGGQCQIPFIGAPFAPVKDLRFLEGLRRWNDRWIHVTRGVGNLHGLRFNCRPEVNLLRLF